MKVSIVGFGKLGSALAAALLDRCSDIVGIDKDEDAFERVLSQDYPEPYVSDILNQGIKEERLKLSLEMDSVSGSDIIFVLVPTPSLPSGAFDVSFAVDACSSIGSVIKRTACKPPIVALSSTVLPGDCEKYIIPAIEGETLVEGKDFYFCYNPEFIRQGSIVNDYQHPDMVLLGTNHRNEVFDVIERLIPEHKEKIRVMSISSSEIAKIALNAYLTTKIVFANLLGLLCDGTSGAEVDEVTEAIALDARISKRYLRAGLGFGGPCFPRDNKAIAHSMSMCGISVDMPVAIDKLNVLPAEWAIRQAKRFSNVLILGRSYKTGTPITDESQSEYIANKLKNAKFYDKYPENSDFLTLEDGIEFADAVIVAMPGYEPKFKDGQTVIDMWRAYEYYDLPEDINYIPFGTGNKK